MPDEEMLESYIDCTGRQRRFRLSIYAEGRFLEAVELRDGGERGLRFVLPVTFGEIPPWGEMRKRIRERLATRHIVRDETGRLQIATDVIRGQLDDGDTDAPALVVDDMVLSWKELGALLQPYTGFGIRIEIRGPGEE